MFATRAYFKDINCPDSLCRRKYCPFKHDVLDERSDNVSVATEEIVDTMPTSFDTKPDPSELAQALELHKLQPYLHTEHAEPITQQTESIPTYSTALPTNHEPPNNLPFLPQIPETESARKPKPSKHKLSTRELRKESREPQKKQQKVDSVAANMEVVNAQLLVAFIEIFEELPQKHSSSSQSQTPKRKVDQSPTTTLLPPVPKEADVHSRSPIQPEPAAVEAVPVARKVPSLRIESRETFISTSVAKAQNRLIRQNAADASAATTEAPTLPLRGSGVIPLQLRQKYLRQLWLECVKIYPDEPPAARERTLHEEQGCHDKSSQKGGYINAVVSAIRRLRRECPTATTQKNASNFSILISPKMSDEELDAVVQGPQLYRLLLDYVMSEEQLTLNGYPRPSKDMRLGEASILVPDEVKSKLRPGLGKSQHTCCRCGKEFSLDPDNLLLQECVYHWGKAFLRRVPGLGVEQRYTCCSAAVFQPGCQVSPSHVFDANKWFDCQGYQQTLPAESVGLEDYGVYSLDCEMVYTTAGFELARVTVVDRQGQLVYDKLVQPLNSILDYNTRFSGLSESMMREVRLSIVDVQKYLLQLFTERSILIGHSLESDLVALKLVHDLIVDTSMVFPHRLGLPKKRALKNIVSDELHLVIQNKEEGHDSFEDALACMRLMQYKVKQDFKKKNRLS